ncbi:MAG: PDZ domain-containing protein [Myxococcota bacterium]
MILFSALLLFLGLAHAGDDDQVVELLSTSQTWDPYRPWVKNDPSTVTWQGVYLGDNTVVTTARAVANTTLIRAIAHGSPDRYPARVVHVEPDLDLALVTVDDPTFFDDLEPATLSTRVPKGTVRTAAWRDRQLEAAQGRVGRFEVRSSLAGVGDAAQFLVTTDLQNGGRSEAVYEGRRLAGLVMTQSGDTARVLPSSVIAHYLEDVARGENYRGVPAFFARWQVHRDPATANWLGQDLPQGIILRSIFSETTSCGVLQPRDVLLEVDGRRVDGNGLIDDPERGRLRFERWLSEGRHPGDQVPVAVWRDGARIELMLTLRGASAATRLVPETEADRAPPYVVAGGLVIRELDEGYLVGWGKNWREKVGLRLAALWDLSARALTAERERHLVVAYVLPDAYNVGYHDIRNVLLMGVNGSPVRSLSDVVSAMKTPQAGVDGEGSYHVLEVIDGGPGRREVVLDATTYEVAHQRILRAYEVPSDRQLATERPVAVPTCVVAPNVSVVQE